MTDNQPGGGSSLLMALQRRLTSQCVRHQDLNRVATMLHLVRTSLPRKHREVGPATATFQRVQNRRSIKLYVCVL